MALRLILHAPTKGALVRARSNARNMARAEPEAEIEIMANAEAAVAAVESGETGAPLLLCGNTLAANGLAAPDGARIIGSAVAHIARRQGEGWIYIRA